MALGPLTNLAMAVRLDSGFPDRLKDLFIMGGNMEGEVDHEITFSYVRFTFKSYNLAAEENSGHIRPK